MSVISFEEARKQLEKGLGSNAELTQNSVSELAGQLPTEQERNALLVLAESHFKGFTTKSTFARKYSDEIAMLACTGMISTHIGGPNWTNFWKITPGGLDFLCFMLNEAEDDDEE